MRPLHRSANASVFDYTAHADLQALVELQVGEHIISWEGLSIRSGGRLDAQTQSQTIIVTVDEPYEQAIPGKRPPLVRDTFVKVTLKAPPLENQMLLPVNALHDDQVYLINSEDKLEKRQVVIDFVQDQIAVIRFRTEA